MGYITDFDGEIRIEPDKAEQVALLLEVLKGIADKCEFVSSGGANGTEYWFHREDEWLAYFPECDIKNNVFSIHSNGKHYNDSVATLAHCVVLLSPKATGKITWTGEDADDIGTIRIANGVVTINGHLFVPNRSSINLSAAIERKLRAKVRMPKYDFTEILSDKNNFKTKTEILRWLQDQLVLNAI